LAAKSEDMNHKPNLKFSAIALLLAVISFSVLQSCVKEEDFDFDKVAEINWNPNLSAPIVHSKLGLDRIMAIVDPGTISVGSDHFVTLVYKGNVVSVYGYQYLRLNDPQQLADQNISLTNQEISTLSAYDTVSTQRPTNYLVGVTNGEHIDSMTLGSGNMNIHISSVIRHSGVLTISMPTAKLNGQPFSKDVPFTFNNSIPVTASGSLDLSGYDFDLSSTGSFNVLPVIYTVKFNDSGNPTYTNETFTVQSDFSGLTIKKVFGDFGQRLFPIANTDSSRIAIFNNAFGGIAYFDDPKATFTVSNSFGMLIDAHFDSLYAFKSQPPPGTYTNIYGFPNPIPVQAPTVVGETADTSFTLDQNNSNVKTVINQGSNYIGYKVSATSNLGGGTHNFLEDSSRFQIDVKVELPMYGYADGFIVQDTADFSLQNIEEVEWAKFRLNITNGFPIDAYTQVYFVDSMFTILDSLISPLQQVIVAGQVDANGVVNKPTLVTTDEYFPQERLQHVYNAKKLLIRGLLNSYQYNVPTKIKIYSDYILDVRIGVQAQLKIKVQ